MISFVIVVADSREEPRVDLHGAEVCDEAAVATIMGWLLEGGNWVYFSCFDSESDDDEINAQKFREYLEANIPKPADLALEFFERMFQKEDYICLSLHYF